MGRAWKSGLQNVPVTPDTLIAVRLIDEDPMFDDPMGDFTIRSSDILAAAAARTVYQVNNVRRLRDGEPFVIL